MYALAISGSPRKGGNTELLLKEVITELKDAGWETELAKVGGTAIRGCIACEKCFENKDTIRLVGIDAPETSRKKHEPGQPFSQKSTKYLAGPVLNKVVDIVSYGEDRYGRTLGVVNADGDNVNLEMVKGGLAEVYRGRPAKGFDNGPYQLAENEAKDAGKGMWSLGDKYISPREWRKMH